MTRTLTRRSLLGAVRELAAADPRLAESVERFGPPPLWARDPGFPTLVHLILEQQVSLASAQAAFDRLETLKRSAPDAADRGGTGPVALPRRPGPSPD